ncbi:MAG: GGDEF domain-containing protein [Ruminiclostridium sp.]|nr:GGDEF domain-containing protein [Ruminiclostridium sp.]
MYKVEQLKKYKYFAELLENAKLEHIIDPLTGLIARPYILGFAKSLIGDNIPFTFGMLDLDNFKFVNDTYGHSAGDAILKGVSEALSVYLDGFGIAGRFGGDEVLIVDVRDIKYAEKKAFFKEMYTDGKVLRRNFELDECCPFITGTIGCATFPDDAAEYDELFAMIDKTLYRGKSKGRNCYIIYVEEKHKNMEIRKLAGRGISAIMQSITRQVEFVPHIENKFRSIIPLLKEEFGMTDLYYTDRNNILHAVLNKEFSESVPDIGQITNDDYFRTNTINDLEASAPAVFGVLKKHKMDNVLIVKIAMNDKTDGYIVCAEPHSRRIWQDDECAVIYFLAKLIAAEIRVHGEKLPE